MGQGLRFVASVWLGAAILVGCSNSADELHSSKVEERVEAIRSLAREGGDAAAKEIAAVVSSPDEATAAEAVRGLGRIARPSASEALVSVAESDARPRVRGEAAVQLGRRRNEAAARTLRTLLKSDPDPQVRGAAATGLGHQGNLADVMGLLEVAESDTDPVVQSRAIGAIEQMIGLRFKFDAWAPPEERAKALARVRTLAPHAAAFLQEWQSAREKEGQP
jgi:HEAT repeat protein